MVDAVDGDGDEKHIVVDGQQRIRACLDFVQGAYAMDGDEVQARWRGLRFDDLSPDEKQTVFGYKFVVRVLPHMADEELRMIFARLNRNVVALNQQELRNAVYWGPFIRSIQEMADEDPFWADSRIFSANDHRRMIDHEFISELVIAHLHGSQNKKDKLEYYYQLYEQEFDARDATVADFRSTTGEIAQLLPDLARTRWRKKSDFYTLFLTLIEIADQFPLPRDRRTLLADRIVAFGESVDSLIRLEEEDWDNPDPNAARYTRAVSRAASDKASRIGRAEALKAGLFAADAPIDEQ
jgi:hypothetical protein